MKVNVVTMNSSYNYGAMLQAYSLQQNIKSLGVECEFIDQRSTLNKQVTFSKSVKGLLTLPYYLLNKNELQRGYKACENFVKEYQTLTDENYADYNKLKNSPTNADVFVTGSDQVWNTLKCKPINFLEFAPQGKKKISYAASMGISHIVEDKKEIVKKYLSDFSAISVREESATEALKEVTDKNINVNIDPVFLLDKGQWQSIQTQNNKLKKPYILCYILFRPKWLNQKLKEIHKQTGKDIVVVDLSVYRNIYNNKTIRSAGPREFLELLDNADGVITSSFHGTALSIVYRKKFYSVINPDSPSRISNILNKLGLTDRVMDTETNVNFDNEIDYSHAESIIKAEQIKSMDYLRENIGG